MSEEIIKRGFYSALVSGSIYVITNYCAHNNEKKLSNETKKEICKELDMALISGFIFGISPELAIISTLASLTVTRSDNIFNWINKIIVSD